MLGKWIMGDFWGRLRYFRCSLCFIECPKSVAIILCTQIVWKMLKAQSLKGVDILCNPFIPPSPTYELYCIRVWKHLCWGCVLIHLSICEPGFLFFFKIQFWEIKILGINKIKTLAKLVNLHSKNTYSYDQKN